MGINCRVMGVNLVSSSSLGCRGMGRDNLGIPGLGKQGWKVVVFDELKANMAYCWKSMQASWISPYHSTMSTRF